MKKKHILSVLAMAAVTFGVTACADTDAQYSIPNVDAPHFVKSSPSTGDNHVKRGEVTVTVKYDKRIFFASQDKDLIEATGATITNAIVYGADSLLTMTVNIPNRGADVNITIPAGVVTNGQGKPADAVTLNFKTTGLDASPVMATSTAATKLYEFLVQNADTKIISGMMANVAWNHTCADKVNEWTGKYPAINGFDYGHMPACKAGANWINYKDITPVKEWSDNNGIVQMMWHWNVPKTKPATSGKVIPSDWSGFLQLTDDNTKAAFANAQVGDQLVVTISDVAEGAQGSIKNSSWTGFVDETGTCWEYFDISGTQYAMTLDATTLADMKANGFILSGHDYTITGVYVVPAGKDLANGTQLFKPTSNLDPNNDYNFYMANTTFDAANALTEGTWENEVWKDDMKTLKEYLTLLKDANIPVLWRPFHEASGKWFWWGKDAESFKNLWKEMFKELKEAGFDNLIWVWTSCGNDNDWYPGDEYVDVVARDLYGDNAASCATEYADLTATYGNKIVTLGECGYSEYTNSRIANISEQWEAGAKWSWFMVWYDNDDAENQHATQEWWQDAMNMPNIITRDMVPNMK